MWYRFVSAVLAALDGWKLIEMPGVGQLAGGRVWWIERKAPPSR